MKVVKKSLSAILALLLLIPFVAFSATAEDEERFMFIDGENIIRQTNTAVIYRGSETVTLNSRGHDVVVDAEGKVTDIREGTIGDDRIIDIPEGGCVISASGTAASRLKSNIKTGSRIYYDSYTQKLFFCDENGAYDPYFIKQINVTGADGSYTLANSETAASKYSYDIAVDANGIIAARGNDVAVPDGGFIVSAATDTDRKTLIMYAIVGGRCSVSEGIATFSYDSTMLLKTMEMAVSDAKAEIETAKNSFADIDTSEAELLIQHTDNVLLTANKPDYYSATQFALSLENDVFDLCTEGRISELRGAFHTPEETNEAQVRETVKAAKAAGLNTIILRATNGIGTFIPLPDSFPFEQDDKFGGFDLLQSYIDICAEEGMALTLSIDVYYNKYASAANAEWVAENENITMDGSSGTSAAAEAEASESATGLQGKYFSPGSEGYKAYFLEYVEYIVTNYSLKSVMFDYLRYPKFSELTDIGYDDETMTAFSRYVKQPLNECYKIRTQLFDSPLWEDWIEFRTGLIDTMAKDISETVRGAGSDITVMAVAARESVDYYYMQNAVNWVGNGWMDGLCVALYEGDSNENDPIPELGYYDGMVSEKTELFSAYTNDKAYLFTGLESSHGYSANAIAEAVSESRSNGADGFIFSNLEDYIAQGYHASLSKNIMKNGAVSPLGNTADSMKAILEFAKEKILNRVLPAGGCDQASADSAVSETDEALVLLGQGILTEEQASELESRIAMLFASAPAKAEILEEFEALTKLASLAKSKSEETVPPNEGSEDNPSSLPDESDVSEDITNAEPESDNGGSEDPAEKDGKSKINVGSILIYGFVGLAMLAAVAGMVIAAKRNKTARPVNRHMTKNDSNEDSRSDKNE